MSAAERRSHAPEGMAEFFDARVCGYEAHMRASVDSFDTLYQSVADALPSSPQNPEIVDLGIGTGVQSERIYRRFPDAHITGIDLSRGMLDALRAKPWVDGRRLTLIQGSFLTLELGEGRYDAAVSVMALHHWGPSVKQSVYQRVHRALRPGGVFVNGDYVLSEAQQRQEHRDKASQALAERPHELHLDWPLSLEQEAALLDCAGFSAVDILFQSARACVFCAHVKR